MTANYFCDTVLKDVWTNHLLPFLLPNAGRMRQHMAIVLWELASPGCIRSISRYRSFWLTNDVVMLVEHTTGWRTDFMLHMDPEDTHPCRVHCTMTIDQVPRTLFQGRMRVWLGGVRVEYYRVNRELGLLGHPWERTNDIDPHDDCVCIRRALLLRAIRMKI
jgi:hypothetical protein